MTCKLFTAHITYVIFKNIISTENANYLKNNFKQYSVFSTSNIAVLF